MVDPTRPPLPLLMRRPNIQSPVPLPTPNVVSVPAPSNRDVDYGYWYGWVPEAVRRHMTVNNDRPINILGVQEQLPESTDPQWPIWINANCPPWNCPPWWAVPLDIPFSKCVPWYEVDTILGGVQTPKEYFYVIKNICYEALNAAQDDVFEISLLVNNSLVARWEDIAVDAAQANPATMYGLAGAYRQMPTQFIVDRRSSISVRARLRGAINLAGVSPNFPGQPIITGNCEMKVILNGWAANLREDRDGGPRPTDLGDMGFIYLDDDQSGGQAG